MHAQPPNSLHHQDSYRLPEGMKRVGYDSDTGRYYFRDRDGSLWEGPEGAQYGQMTRGASITSGSPRRPRCPCAHSDTAHASPLFIVTDADTPAVIDGRTSDVEDEEAEIGIHSRADGYAPLAVDAVRQGLPAFIRLSYACLGSSRPHRMALFILVTRVAMPAHTGSCSPSSSLLLSSCCS